MNDVNSLDNTNPIPVPPPANDAAEQKKAATTVQPMTQSGGGGTMSAMLQDPEFKKKFYESIAMNVIKDDNQRKQHAKERKANEPKDG